MLHTHYTCTAGDPSPVKRIDQFGDMLLEQLHATSVVPAMADRGLLTSEDVQVINLAASEYQKNSYILGRVQNMDNRSLLRFCDILQSMGHQQHIGAGLINGNVLYLIIRVF